MKKINLFRTKNKSLNNGFTLIELLIFMGIFSILIVALFQLMLTVFDTQLEAQSTAGISQDARYVLNKLTYQIKKSTTVTSPAVGVQSSTLVTSDGTTNYTYSASNGNFLLSNSLLGSTDQLNSVNSSVSAVSFLVLSDTKGKNEKTVTVSFTIRSKILRRSGYPSNSYSLTIGIR